MSAQRQRPECSAWHVTADHVTPTAAQLHWHPSIPSARLTPGTIVAVRVEGVERRVAWATWYTEGGVLLGLDNGMSYVLPAQES